MCSDYYHTTLTETMFAQPVQLNACIAQGPFGTGSSTPSYGMCPVDKKWHNENMFMRDLAHAKLHAFDATHGFFMWNWKTELEVLCV
jgi:aryl-phospho-beta-D-glucosidase BglC (GH1 family)